MYSHAFIYHILNFLNAKIIVPKNDILSYGTDTVNKVYCFLESNNAVSDMYYNDLYFKYSLLSYLKHLYPGCEKCYISFTQIQPIFDNYILFDVFE